MFKRPLLIIFILTAGISIAQSNDAQHLKRYRFQDLGNIPPYEKIYPTGINDNGVICGYVGKDEIPFSNAMFLFTNANFKTIDVPGGFVLPSDLTINIQDQLIFTAQEEETYQRRSFFRDETGTLTELPPGIELSAINSKGDCAGRMSSADGLTLFPCIWHAGEEQAQIIQLNLPYSFYCEVYTINDQGFIGGFKSYTQGDPEHAFISDYNGNAIDLGNAYTNRVEYLNNNGDAVIEVNNRLQTLYFRKSSGETNIISRALGDDNPFHIVSGLNDNGEIIGYSENNIYEVTPFIHSNGSSYNLIDLIEADLSHWTDVKPTAINNKGEIVGVARYVPQNQPATYHLFLLIPLE